MDLHIIEGLDEIRPSVYRVAMKLLSLQRLRHMDLVFFRHITAALPSVGGAKLRLNRQEVTRIVKRMFHSMSQEGPSHVTEEAPEEICSLMFSLNDRSQSGFISTVSLQTSLIALSAECLLVKYRALVRVSEDASGSVSRSGLRSLLQDLSQVPGAVQEEGVFTDVEAAVRSCFHKVSTPTTSEEHVLSWLQSEPPLLLWLPTLYRLAVSRNVSHAVRCHTCKTRPFSGLRYRCMKCVNVHLCQSCFWTDRWTRKHKTHHAVLEFCTQPTWRESLSLLLSSARHALSPWRYTQRQDPSGRDLIRVEPEQAPDSAWPACHASTRLTASAVTHTRSFDQDGAIHQPPSCSSKALQTHRDTSPQQLKASVLLTEVRNLQRDKWLMEQQLQVLRLNVQSEQGILEDRCSGMEVTMETLKEHNLRLQHCLMQAVNKMEVQDANNEHQDVHREDTKDREDMKETKDTKDREQIWDRKDTDEDTIGHYWSEEELQPPIMHQYTALSQDIYYEEDPAGDWFFCPIGQQEGPQQEVTCLSEEEGCGKCSPEELLQETGERLKTVMETDRLRYRQTGERKRAALLVAADKVCDSIRHLVDVVRADAY